MLAVDVWLRVGASGERLRERDFYGNATVRSHDFFGREQYAAAKPRGRRCGWERRRRVPFAAAGDRPYDKTFDDLRFEMMVGAPFKRSIAYQADRGDGGAEDPGFAVIFLPTPQRAGITAKFVLVRDNQECCFGQGAALYDCILVDMKQGKTAEYSIRPVAAGDFRRAGVRHRRQASGDLPHGRRDGRRKRIQQLNSQVALRS